jgi:hypothetical protein
MKWSNLLLSALILDRLVHIHDGEKGTEGDEDSHK